jgi:hypothetical protein
MMRSCISMIAAVLMACAASGSSRALSMVSVRPPVASVIWVSRRSPDHSSGECRNVP